MFRQEKKTSRNIWFDNLKGLLILGVVLGHFMQVGIDKDVTAAKGIWIFIYSFHMPLFLFTNGCMCEHVINDKKKLKERVIELFSLYVILKIIIFVIRSIGGKEPDFSLFSDSEIPWYLFALAVFYLLSYVLKGFNKIWLLSFSIILALIAGFDSTLEDFCQISRVIVFYPFFVLGWIIGIERIQKFVRQMWVRIVGIIVLAALVYVCVCHLDDYYIFRELFTGRNPYNRVDVSYYFAPLYRLIAYVISVIVSIGVMAIVPNRRLPVLNMMGQHTMQIYFFHRPILYILTYVGLYWKMFDMIGNAAIYVWGVCALLLCIVLVFPMFGKPLKWYSKVINSQRMNKNKE